MAHQRLDDLIPAMTEHEPEVFVRRAERVLRRRRAVGGATLAAATVVLALGVSQAMQRPVAPATTPSPSRSVPASTVPGECPHYIPAKGIPASEGGQSEMKADILIWESRTYGGTEVVPRRPGELLFTIRCSLAEIDDGPGYPSLPWPDRTASVLVTGARVHEIVGIDPTCAVTAVGSGRTTWRLYRAFPTPEGC